MQVVSKASETATDASQVLQGRALPDGVVGAQRGTAALAIGVNERSSGLDDDRNVTLSLLFGWPIMLPERMRARRAPSSGKARGTTTVATHGSIVAGPNAGTRITTRHVNPNILLRPRLELCKSKHSSVVLLRGSRLQRLQSRESRWPTNNALHFGPSVDGFHPRRAPSSDDQPRAPTASG